MSQFILSSGIVDRQLQLVPPSDEIKTTAVLPPIGSGSQAEAAMCDEFAALTARFGSTLKLVSPLSDSGMISTTVTDGCGCASPFIQLGQLVTVANNPAATRPASQA